MSFTATESSLGDITYFNWKRWLLFVLVFSFFWAANSYYRPVPLDRLERFSYDWNIIAEGKDDKPTKIALVTAGEASLSRLGRWPWPRAYHANLIERLRMADTIMLDILFPEKSDAVQDKALTRAVRENGRVVTAVHLVADEKNCSSRIVTSYSELAEMSLNSGYTNMQTDIDGMVRYCMPLKRIGSRGILSFPLAGVSADTGESFHINMRPHEDSASIISSYSIPVDDQGRLWIDFSGAGYPRYEYWEVLEGHIQPEVFEGKIVIVGAAASGVEDFFIVPTPMGPREITGVQLNAEIITMLLNRQGIVRTPPWVDAAITFPWVVLGFLIGVWGSPHRGSIFLLTAIGLEMLLTHYLFVSERLWIAAWTPTLGMLTAFSIVVLKRFFFSSRELAIRQFSMAHIHDLLVPRDHSLSYDAYLNQNWSQIAACTGIHLMKTRTPLNLKTDDRASAASGPLSPGNWELTLVEDSTHAFRFQLYIPLPRKDGRGATEYTLLGWNQKLPDGRIQSIAAVVLASSWYFTLLEESLARKKMLINTIDAIAAAVDAKDAETGGHSRRVARISMEIAEYLELSPEIQEDIYLGALIHDIGKIGIPDAVLTKKGKLTDPEMDLIKTHPEIGKKIMAAVDLPPLTAQALYEHHERCDGNGYPNHLAKDQISLAGKILAVADVFDAMTQKRYYKEDIPITEVLDFLHRHKGSQFDETVVDALITLRTPVWNSHSRCGKMAAAG